MTKGPAQDYLPDQHLTDKKIKVKESPLSNKRESRRDHSQSNRIEQPRESRSRVPIQTAPWNYSHQNDSWQEGGAKLEYREAGAHDKFPCFANRLASVWLPHKFKPSNHSKYDGKTEPRQWLRIYSQSIELASGDVTSKHFSSPWRWKPSHSNDLIS
jgi:hypothetical protein